MRMMNRAGGKHPPVNVGHVAGSGGVDAAHVWAFDELAATDNLRDIIGTSHLIHAASPTLVASPINFRGRGFNGTTQDFIGAVYAGDFAASVNVSVCGCLYIDPTHAAKKYVGVYGSNAGNISWRVAINADRSVNFEYTSSVGGPVAIVSTFKIPAGKWIPWAWTRNDSTGVVKFYVEGGIAQTSTGNPAAANTNVNAAYHVGVSETGTGFFVGRMGTLAVYTATLTDSEIEDIFSAMRMLNFPTTLYSTAEVKDAGGTWRDLSNLRNTNYLKSIQIDDDVDANARSVTVVCQKDKRDSHLTRYHDNILNRTPFGAAYASTSYSLANELLIEKHRLRVKWDRRALDSGYAQDIVAAGTPNWNILVDCLIDKTRSNGNRNEISIEAREYISAAMLDVYMPVTSVRSNSAGTAVETVVQGIITDAKGDTPPSSYINNWGLPNLTDFDLLTPISPGWNIRTYQQQPGSLFQEISKLFEQIGWVLRPRYEQSSDSFRLTAYSPDRNQKHPTLTVDDTFVMEAGDDEVSVADVRNEVWVTFVPKPGTSLTVPSIITGDVTQVVGTLYLGPTGTYARATTSAGGSGGDEGNRAVFRVRSNNLHSSEEGSDSITIRGVRRMIVGEIALNNVDTVAEAQSYAVAMLRDLQEPKIARSDKVPSLPEAELGDLIKARPGYRLTSALTSAITAWSFTSDRSGDMSQLGMRGRPSGGTQRHLDREVGAQGTPTPTIDPTTGQMQAGMSTRARRQIQALLVDGVGQHMRQDARRPGAVRNGDISVRSFGDTLPDTWSMAGTAVYGTDVAISASNTDGGPHVLDFLTNLTSGNGVMSDFIPVVPSSDIDVYARIYLTSSTHTFTVDAFWYKSDFTASATASTAGTAVGLGAVASGSWRTKDVGGFLSPSDARFMRLVFRRVAGAGGAGSVLMQRTWVAVHRNNFRARATGATTLGSASPGGQATKVVFGSTSTKTGDNAFENGNCYDNGTSTFTAQEPGFYVFNSQIRVDAPGPLGFRGYIQIRKNSTTGADGTLLGESTYAAPDTTNDEHCIQVSTGVIWLNLLDTVNVWGFVTNQGGVGIPVTMVGTGDTWFSGRVVDVD